MLIQLFTKILPGRPNFSLGSKIFKFYQVVSGKFDKTYQVEAQAQRALFFYRRGQREEGNDGEHVERGEGLEHIKARITAQPELHPEVRGLPDLA